MYHVYSDASWSKEVATAVTLIVTETHYIDTVIKKYMSVRDNACAELAGVMQSIKYCKRNKLYPFTLYTDNESVVLMANRIMKGDIVSPESKEWKSFQQLVTGMTFDIKHFKGHSTTINPNTYCDRLARAVLSLNMARW